MHPRMPLAFLAARAHCWLGCRPSQLKSLDLHSTASILSAGSATKFGEGSVSHPFETLEGRRNWQQSCYKETGTAACGLLAAGCCRW